ncbi:unnamed protein product, partial [Symbiodinium sp. KB8]
MMPTSTGQYEVRLRYNRHTVLASAAVGIGEPPTSPPELLPIACGTLTRPLGEDAACMLDPEFALLAGRDGHVTAVVYGRTRKGYMRMCATPCTSGAATLQPQRWHHVSMTVSGVQKKIRVAVDGQATSEPTKLDSVNLGSVRRFAPRGLSGRAKSTGAEKYVGHWRASVSVDGADTAGLHIVLANAHTGSDLVAYVVDSEHRDALAAMHPDALASGMVPPEAIVGKAAVGSDSLTLVIEHPDGSSEVLQLRDEAQGDAGDEAPGVLRGSYTAQNADAGSPPTTGTVELQSTKQVTLLSDGAGEALTQELAEQAGDAAVAVELAASAAASVAADLPTKPSQAFGQGLLIGWDGSGRTWQGSISHVRLWRCALTAAQSNTSRRSSETALALQFPGLLVDGFPLTDTATSLLRRLGPLQLPPGALLHGVAGVPVAPTATLGGGAAAEGAAHVGDLLLPAGAPAVGSMQWEMARAPSMGESNAFAVTVSAQPLLTGYGQGAPPSTSDLEQLVLDTLVREGAAPSGAATALTAPTSSASAAALVVPPTPCSVNGLRARMNPVPTSTVTVTITALQAPDISGLDSVTVSLGGRQSPAVVTSAAPGLSILSTLSAAEALAYMAKQQAHLSSPHFLQSLWDALALPGTNARGMEDSARAMAFEILLASTSLQPKMAAAVAARAAVGSPGASSTTAVSAPWAGADWGAFTLANVVENTSISGTTAAMHFLCSLIAGVEANGGLDASPAQVHGVHDAIVETALASMERLLLGEPLPPHRATIPALAVIVRRSLRPAAAAARVQEMLLKLAEHAGVGNPYLKEHSTLAAAFGVLARPLNSPWCSVDPSTVPCLGITGEGSTKAAPKVLGVSGLARVDGIVSKDELAAAVAAAKGDASDPIVEKLRKSQTQGSLNIQASNVVSTPGKNVRSTWLDLGRPVHVRGVNLSALAELGADACGTVQVTGYMEPPVEV